MKFFRAVYSFYALLVFTVIFLITIPFFIIPILSPGQFKMIGIINRIWAKIWLTLIFLRIKVNYEQDLDADQQYIICANHFSYLDIPAVGLGKINAIFVGKSSIQKVPLFGWMYRKLHITVNRKSPKSRYETIIRSKEALENGKSLIIFPEGGIVSKDPPQMVRFKDGAFRLSIESGIPILPVTMPNNWWILPESLLLSNGTVEVFFHKPVETDGMSMKDLPELKQRVWGVIDETLKNS